MKAFLKNYRQAPRKVRLIADSVRGKNVKEVLVELSFVPNKAALPLRKLVVSALANAQQSDPSVTPEELFISHISIDKGLTFVRYMPRAFGRATPINRESSHVRIELARAGATAPKVPEEKAEKEDEKAPIAKKAATKKAASARATTPTKKVTTTKATAKK